METRHFDPTVFLPTALTKFVFCPFNHAHGGFVLSDYCDFYQTGTSRVCSFVKSVLSLIFFKDIFLNIVVNIEEYITQMFYCKT